MHLEVGDELPLPSFNTVMHYRLTVKRSYILTSCDGGMTAACSCEKRSPWMNREGDCPSSAFEWAHDRYVSWHHYPEGPICKRYCTVTRKLFSTSSLVIFIYWCVLWQLIMISFTFRFKIKNLYSLLYRENGIHQKTNCVRLVTYMTCEPRNIQNFMKCWNLGKHTKKKRIRLTADALPLQLSSYFVSCWCRNNVRFIDSQPFIISRMSIPKQWENH